MKYEIVRGICEELPTRRRGRPSGLLDICDSFRFRYEYAYIVIDEYNAAKEYIEKPWAREGAGRELLTLVGVSGTWCPSYKFKSAKGFDLRGRKVGLKNIVNNF